MTTEERIQDLAAKMNVTPGDVRCFAQSMLNSMKADKVADTFGNGTEEVKGDFVKAYAVHAVKKFNSFATTLQTNPVAKKAIKL